MHPRRPGNWLAILAALMLVGAGCQNADPKREQPATDARAGQSPLGNESAGRPSAERTTIPGKRGGTLTMALFRDTSILNPFIDTQGTNFSVREQAYESLLGLDDRGVLQPKLAERWEISPDGRVYTFHLRRGVQFHSGEEMTAEDLKWVFEYVMNPANGAFGEPQVDGVQQVDALDSHTLRVNLKTGSPAFIRALTDIRVIFAVPRGSLEEGLEKPTSAPPGTGPFRFVEWQPRQRLVYERFDDYWGHKAYLDRVVFRPITDGTVRMTALRSGDVDVVERTPNEWVREILDGKLPGVGIVEAPYSGFRNVQFNVADPPFDNLKLRLAVAHALDREEILEAAYYGLGRIADQVYPEGHLWYVTGLRWPEYDLNRARQLLQEAGYNGQEIPILLEPGIQEVEGTAMQAQLRKIGMNIRLEVVDNATKRERVRRGEFALETSGGFFDPDPSATYGSEYQCPADLRKRGSNFRGYCDKEMDTLLQRLETEMDQARRQDLLRQILTKVSQAVPELNIGFAPRYFTFREYVKAFPLEQNGRWMPHEAGLNYTWLDR